VALRHADTILALSATINAARGCRNNTKNQCSF
jgi:hypothetical protein